MKPTVALFTVCLVAAAAGLHAAVPAPPEGLPSVSARIEGLSAHRGLLTFHTDAARGRVWLEVPPAGERGEVGTFLYVEGLVTGVGSNPIGLDRGQLGPARLVSLRRLGGRLLVEEQNLRYRALSDRPAERAAVRESFATSVLWAGELAALDPDGRALVDLTPFLVRDAHGVAAALKRAGEGSFALDPARSAVDLDACLAFPDNVELEAVLTYAGSDPGPLLAETAPLPEAVTLVQHHSFVRLPGPGYRPRRFDPRAGSYSVRFLDYAVPLTDSVERRFIVRHRLDKLDPAAPRSLVAKPIVYHVDPGAPEPVRSALVEGASWWARAFEEAGFADAFRVELLPEGAHPLDVRYNVIQWVHRSTRGWSFGGGVIDPRTGEMLKGHVSLGSLRVRQDRLLFEGLAGTAASGSGTADDPVELALARIRQLAAHEVGHALGLAHNFAASTYGGRASVMDYPAPLVEVTAEGELDFSRAYGVGVGAWDLHAVRYAYEGFPPGADEEAELDRLARSAAARGLLFLTDADARPLASAHPLAHLWDNGDDPAEALRQTMAVREIALARFGEANVSAGQPLALLEEVLATVYLHHRYQLEAAAKLLGGLDYRYALRGDGQPPARMLDGGWQRRALDALLETLDPEALDLPEPILALLLPRPSEYEPNREMFARATGPAFDGLGAAATAAGLSIAALLEPARAARLVDQHRRDPGLPGLEEVLDRLLGATVEAPPHSAERRAEIARSVAAAVVAGLIQLSGSPDTTAAVRARVDARLGDLLGALRREGPADRTQASHRAFLVDEIEHHLERRAAGPRSPARPQPPPPGSPMGAALADGEDGCSWAAPQEP